MTEKKEKKVRIPTFKSLTRSNSQITPEVLDGVSSDDLLELRDHWLPGIKAFVDAECKARAKMLAGD